MNANQAAFPVATMARVLGVSRVGYDAWASRPPSAHAKADAVLLERIRTLHARSREGAQQNRMLDAAQKLARRWHQQGYAVQREILLAIGAEVTVQRHEFALHLASHRLLALLSSGRQGTSPADGEDRHLPRITIAEPVALRRAGREMALLVGTTIATDQSDPSLVRLIAKAWAIREALVSSAALSLTAFAAEQGISQSYATRLVRLAWLAPDIVEAILGGCQPAKLTASRLMGDTRIPPDWQEQRSALGFI